MIQVAAALLFAIAASLGLTVILAMLKNNENAIIAALLGEGAFAGHTAPATDPLPNAASAQRAAFHRAAPRMGPGAAYIRVQLRRAQLSRAA